jgi:hypothetical protein
MTEGALVTQQGIAMALRQSGSAGRHRRKSRAGGWTMPQHHKTPQAATGGTAPRHRKTPQAPAGRTAPRHRKKGRGNIQAIYPSFRIGQDNSIRIATRRAALPGALALGLLAVGGAIAGGFSMPLPDTDRADGSGPGGVTSAPMPPPPALTAMSTPSTLPARADRGLRGPVDASEPDALPISDQALTGGVSGNGSAQEPAQNGTTTAVRDGVRGPRAFAPSVTAEPSGGQGGGGGSAESSVPPTPPAVGRGALSDVFGPGGPLNWLPGTPGEQGGNGAAGGGANGHGVGSFGDLGTDDDGVTAGEGGPDHPGRVDRSRGTRGTGDAGGAGRGFGSPGKTSDAGSPGNGGGHGQSGSGGQDRRGGGRR